MGGTPFWVLGGGLLFGQWSKQILPLSLHFPNKRRVDFYWTIFFPVDFYSGIKQGGWTFIRGGGLIYENSGEDQLAAFLGRGRLEPPGGLGKKGPGCRGHRNRAAGRPATGPHTADGERGGERYLGGAFLVIDPEGGPAIGSQKGCWLSPLSNPPDNFRSALTNGGSGRGGVLAPGG